MAGPLETKAVAGPFVTLVAGYLSALAIETVPWLADNLTADQKLNLPIVLAFLLSGIAAYFAPHTHRPDLTPDAPTGRVQVSYTPPAKHAAEPPQREVGSAP